MQRYRYFLFGKSKNNSYLQNIQRKKTVFGSIKGNRRPWHSSASSGVMKISSQAMGKSYLSRSEKRSRINRIVLKTSGALLFSFLFVAIIYTPAAHYIQSLDFFLVRKIDISGCEVTRPAKIKKITGLNYATSMFAVDLEQLEAKLVADPWIRRVKIEKLWPHELKIHIQEHDAAALLVKGVTEAEKMVYINSRGEEIAQVKPGDDLDFPVITIETGFTGEQKDALFKDAIYFLRLVAGNNPNLPAQSVSELHLSDEEGIVIRLVDFPFPIYFGEGEVSKKYRQLRKVLAVLYKKRRNKSGISKVEYIRMEYYNNKVLVAQSNSG